MQTKYTICVLMTSLSDKHSFLNDGLITGQISNLPHTSLVLLNQSFRFNNIISWEKDLLV